MGVYHQGWAPQLEVLFLKGCFVCLGKVTSESGTNYASSMKQRGAAMVSDSDFKLMKQSFFPRKPYPQLFKIGGYYKRV